jgi:hypothetical protein
VEGHIVSAEQVTLDAYREDLARRSRDHGAGIDLWRSDEWAKAAQLVLDELIDRSLPFTSEDVRVVVGPPPSNGSFGGLFLRAAKAGRIEAVGYERSRRPARHSWLLRQWIGVNPP